MVPLVYNCGGYESLEVIKLLDGIIDIYMPDTKFSREEDAASYCNAPDYPRALQGGPPGDAPAGGGPDAG